MARPRSTPRSQAKAGRLDGGRNEVEHLTIKVQSLGAARVLVGTQTIGASSGMLLSLLLRVVYAPGYAVPRDTLLDELWPGQPVLRQRGNLRQALYKLRTLGVRVALVSGAVRFDRRQLERTFSVERTSEHFERDVTRGSEPFGPFLPGYVAPSEAWARWLEDVRDVVHGDLRRVLVEQLRMRRERVDWGGAAVLSRWLLQFDPLNEDATLAMAECTMLSGAKAEAVAILDRYLAELGPNAGDIRLPATLLRRRFTEPPVRRRPSLAATERHFVGREREMADLTLKMRRARWHDGSAVLLHGPPGIGKTRLCTELGKVAQIEGYREVRLECRETDQQRPLSVILNALPILLSSPGALGSAPESLAVLRKLVGEDVSTDTPEPEVEHEPTVAEAAGAALTAAERYERTMRTVRAQSIRHAIIDLVAAVSDERPVMIVIDDAHWLDDASWEVMSDLIQRVNAMRLFIVLTSRFATLRAERPARMPTNLTVTRVPGLAPEDCLRLARAIGQDLAAHPTEAIEQWLINSCEGTPLMLRALMDHWVITGDASGVPPTLSVLLEQRLDRLSSTALMALQAISLLGRQASLDRIQASLQLPTHGLLQALEQLEESGCLAKSDAALVITHDLVGKSARRRMSSLVEATLRTSIAHALEEEYKSSREIDLLMEALTHIELSVRPEALSRFVVRYEEDLLEGGRPASVLGAIQRLQIAVPSLRKDRKMKRLQSRLALEAGEYRRALESARGSWSISDDISGMSDHEADQLLSIVDSAYRADPVADRDELARTACGVAMADKISASIRLRAAEIGLTIAANTCDDATAATCISTINAVPSRSIPEGKLLRLLLLYHTIFGDIHAAEKIAKDILEQSDSLQQSTTTVIDLGRAAFALRLCGNSELSRSGFQQQYSMALELGAPRLAQYSAWQLAQLELDAGNLPEVDRWNAILSELLTTDDDPISSSFATAHFCRYAIERQDQGNAFRLLEEVREALPRFPTQKAAAYLIALELGTRLLSEDWIPSDGLIEAGIEKHRRTSRYGTTDYLTSVLAESMARAGKKEAAKALVSVYLKDIRRERFTPALALNRTIKNLESS